MTTTYKPLTPGEALDAVIAGKRVEYAYESSDWNAAGLGFTFEAKSEKSFKYRLAVERTVDEAFREIFHPDERVAGTLDERWFRLFAALKREIKTEIREEMSK